MSVIYLKGFIKRLETLQKAESEKNEALVDKAVQKAVEKLEKYVAGCWPDSRQPLRELYELLRDLGDRFRDNHRHTKNAIEFLRDSRAGYGALWRCFAKPEVIADLKRWVLPEIKPMKLEGRWNIPGGSLEKLKRIDSNPKRNGIKGTKKERDRLKYYLKKHRKRPDIAETLYWKDDRIETEMACGRMFSQE